MSHTKESIQKRFREHIAGFLGFGLIITCRDGWNEIIWDALDQASKLDPDMTVVQIKEKFGGLDIHINSQKSEICTILEQAREKSLQTCEACGTMKDVTMFIKNSWMKTMCEKCFEDWK